MKTISIALFTQFLIVITFSLSAQVSWNYSSKLTHTNVPADLYVDILHEVGLDFTIKSAKFNVGYEFGNSDSAFSISSSSLSLRRYNLRYILFNSDTSQSQEHQFRIGTSYNILNPGYDFYNGEAAVNTNFISIPVDYKFKVRMGGECYFHIGGGFDVAPDYKYSAAHLKLGFDLGGF